MRFLKTTSIHIIKKYLIFCSPTKVLPNFWLEDYSDLEIKCESV
jgi:hypothetical protein